MKEYRLIPKKIKSKIQLTVTEKEVRNDGDFMRATDQNGNEWKVNKNDYTIVRK